jgi:hypothetical protein
MNLVRSRENDRPTAEIGVVAAERSCLVAVYHSVQTESHDLAPHRAVFAHER